MQLLAIAVYDYGLTPDIFWTLTPAQFYAIGTRHKASEKEQVRVRDYLAAGISATIAACHGAKNISAEQYLTFSKDPPRKKTQEELRHIWRNCVVPRVNAIQAANKKRSR